MTAAIPSARPLRVLMTVDAVGGVWRYAMDLAAGLRMLGVETVFLSLGPKPSPAQMREAQALGGLVCSDAPLDWMVEDQAALAAVPRLIDKVAQRERVDLLHLNLPSQAADVSFDGPVVAVAHSCTSTWFRAVRGSETPAGWAWQHALNRRGFAAADAVLAPSASHAALMRIVYGPIAGLAVVYNASRVADHIGQRQDYAFAAGRWWDDGKNGAVLDAAAPFTYWPLMLAGANAGPNGQFLPLENVHHRGALSHDETMALMRRAGIVVSPSLYEPFGLAALEAARSASPLVLADIPTYRELWEDAAIFADPRDPRAFAEAINRLARDSAMRRHLGRQAQARSHSFGIRAQAEAVLHIYRRLATRASHDKRAEFA